MNDSTRRIVRTMLQLIAGGGLAGLFMQLAKDIPEPYSNYIPLAGAAIIAVAQIMVEQWTGNDIGVQRSGGEPN